MSLKDIKIEAKKLKKGIRRGDEDAVALYQRYTLRLQPVEKVQHIDCLNVVARQYGYDGWSEAVRQSGGA